MKLMEENKALRHSQVRRHWDRLSRLPFGRAIIGLVVGFTAPYTAAIGARIESLGPGSSRVTLRDRRRVRNHLGSVHAMALANLAELSANMAVMYSLPADMRMIVKDFAIRFDRKARGTLTATCRAPELCLPREGPVHLEVQIADRKGEVVAVATQTCLIGMMPPKSPNPERA